MTIKQESKYNTIEEYIGFLASNTNINVFTSNPNVNTQEIPKSMEEAMAYSNFWNPILDEFKEDIGKIEFFYQEKNKELPLSFGKKLLKSVGFNVKPEVKEGKVRYDKVNPEVIRNVNPSKSLVNIVTRENEWKRLNSIAQNTEDFSAPFVMLPENLCYQVNIPLECISGICFKSTEFLNKKYSSEEQN